METKDSENKRDATPLSDEFVKEAGKIEVDREGLVSKIVAELDTPEVSLIQTP